MKFAKKIVILLLIAIFAYSLLPVVQAAAEEEPCSHDYIGGICMNCFELDPDYRHPCLNGHDFDDCGACRNCSIYDSSFFDRCKDDAHDLDENGQCKACRYYEEIVKQSATTDLNKIGGVGLTILAVFLVCLLIVDIAAFVYLLLKLKK